MYNYTLSSSTPLRLINNGGGYLVVPEYPSPEEAPTLPVGKSESVTKAQGHSEDITLTRTTDGTAEETQQ